MRFTVAILAALILVGCDPIATERVSLLPRTSAGTAQATSKVVVETSEAETAVEMVGRVMQQHGLGDGETYPDPTAGVIKWWALSVEQAHQQKRGSLTCRVYLRDGQLQVLFTEFGRLSSSRVVNDMTAEVRTAFVERFGIERVR
jgi:hypothetical protein